MMNLIFGKYSYLDDPYFYLIEWVYYWRDFFSSKPPEASLIEFTKYKNAEDPFDELYEEDFITRHKIKVKEWASRRKVSPSFGLEFAARNIQLTEFDGIKKCLPLLFENVKGEVRYNISEFSYGVRLSQKIIDSQKKLESILKKIAEKKEAFFENNISFFLKEVINQSLNNDKSFEVALDRSAIFFKKYEPDVPDYSELLYMFEKLQEELQETENLSVLYDKYLLRYPFFALLIKTLITLVNDKFKFNYFLAPNNYATKKFHKINGAFFVFKFSKLKRVNSDDFGQFCLSINSNSPEIKFTFDQISKSIQNKSHIKIRFYNSEIIDKIGRDFIYECFKKNRLKNDEIQKLINKYKILSLHPSRNDCLKFNFHDIKTFLHLEDRLNYLFNTIKNNFVLKNLNSKIFSDISRPNIKAFIKNKFIELNIKPSFLRNLNSRIEAELQSNEELQLYLYEMKLVSSVTPENIKRMLNYLNYGVEIQRTDSDDAEYEIHSKEAFR